VETDYGDGQFRRSPWESTSTKLFRSLLARVRRLPSWKWNELSGCRRNHPAYGQFEFAQAHGGAAFIDRAYLPMRAAAATVAYAKHEHRAYKSFPPLSHSRPFLRSSNRILHSPTKESPKHVKRRLGPAPLFAWPPNSGEMRWPPITLISK
jgi:hypothetical protein